ncbi:MAG: MBL fold metallo-hydrolase, partial [Aureliella sp.]
MKLHCLGTTGYHPSSTRQTACYYLPELSLVLDAGTGIIGLTNQLRAEPRESLDIFLSHAHLDHIIGLTFLLDTLAVTSLKRVRVLGAAVKLRAVREHLFSEHL